MFDKARLMTSIGAALLCGVLLASPAFAQSASLYGGGACSVGVGAGGGGGTGMDPAGSGPGPSGGTPFGGWPAYEEPGKSGLVEYSPAPAPAMAAAPETETKQPKKRKPVAAK